MKSIYEMKLHETIETEYYKILRVAGGWVYITRQGDSPSSVFVTWNNEFMGKDIK